MSAPAVVVSRSAEDGGRRDFEDALIQGLAAQGVDILVVPHVYGLAPGDEATERLAGLPGPVVLASWLHPRPAEWTLRYLGFAGEARCIDLATFCCPGTGVGEMMEALGGARGGGSVEGAAGEARDLWYPVIDYSRCISCGQCFDFCLFGVYERADDGRVTVAHPTNCKMGCPACARVCPAGAIMFPHYERDEAIAGAPGKEIASSPSDRDALVAAVRSAAASGCDCSEAVHEALELKAGEARSACGWARECECSIGGTARNAQDGIDDLIDALDKLDV